MRFGGTQSGGGSSNTFVLPESYGASASASAASNATAITNALAAAATAGRPVLLGTYTTNGFSIPANSRVFFGGTLTGTVGQSITVNAENVILTSPSLVGISLVFGVSADHVSVYDLVSDGAEWGLKFETNGLVSQTRAKNITVLNPRVSGATVAGVLINGCENVVIRGGYAADDCARGWYNFGSRNLLVEGFELKGRWPAGFLNLSYRSVSGQLGFQNTRYVKCKVADFHDPANSEGEGISFDCHGNSSTNTSIVLTTTVSAVGSDYVTPTTNTSSAYGAIDYAVRFQSGKLIGRAFRVYYQGASGTGNWSLEDGFSQVSSLVTAGDVISLELDCRGNLIEDCEIRCSADSSITRTARNAIHIYGIGGVKIVRPILVADEVDQLPVPPDIRVRSLRGIIDDTKDYCVAHNVSVEGVNSMSNVIFDAYSYNSKPLAWTRGCSILNCSVKQLEATRQIDFMQVGNRYEKQPAISESWNSSIPTIPTSVAWGDQGRVFTVRGNIAQGTTTTVLAFDIPEVDFFRSYEVEAVISWNGYVGVIKRGVFSIRRNNEATSTLTVTAVDGSTAVTMASASSGYVNLTDFTLAPSLTGSTTYNSTDASFKIDLTATATGTGASGITMDFHLVLKERIVAAS